MLTTMEKILLALGVTFSTILTVSLILAPEAGTVQLVTNPKGPYIRAIAGEPFNISCEGFGDEESKFSFMKWQNPAGSVFTEGNIPGVIKNENKLVLSILNPTFVHGGTYKCSAVYNNETNLQYEVYLEFYNLEPEFNFYFHNLTVRENASVEMYCSARGQSPITYNWYNQEGEIIAENENRSIFVLNSGNLSTLNIKTVEMRHEGIYRCTAENNYGSSSAVYALFVLGHADDGHPDFGLPFENVTAEEGTKLILQCHALGAKPMTYTWYNQDDDKITDNSSMSIFVSNFEDYSLLTFEELRMENEGLYSCSASNTYGIESKMYYLRVTVSNGSDTNATSQFRNAKVLNVTTNSVQFHIATSGSVKSIQVKYSESRTRTDYTITLTPVPGNVYTIADLKSSGLYDFQFRTTPAEGNDWSKVYQVTMLPDLPEFIFHTMNKNSVTVGWWRKSDEILRGTIDHYEIKYFSVQMQGGNSWKPSDCAVTIQVPACLGTKYTITGLYPNVYYQIEIRAHTAAGYGEANRQKVFLPE